MFTPSKNIFIIIIFTTSKLYMSHDDQKERKKEAFENHGNRTLKIKNVFQPMGV